MGDGMRWAAQRVEGDFVLTIRVKDFRNAVGSSQPTNDSRAQFGIRLQPELATLVDHQQGFNWYKCMYYDGRYDTPGRTDRGLTAKHFAASYHKVKMPGSHYRLSRKANQIKAEYRSPDSEDWELVFEEQADLPDAVYVGPYLNFAASPDPQAFWKLEIDQVSLER